MSSLPWSVAAVSLAHATSGVTTDVHVQLPGLQPTTEHASPSRHRASGAVRDVCGLPQLDVTAVGEAHFTRQFVAEFRGRVPVVIRGLASGPSWRRARRRWARKRLYAEHGRLGVWPSDLHRGCLLAPGAASSTNGSTIRRAMRARGGGCCYLQPHHPLPQALKRDFQTPEALRMVRLHGPSLSIGGRGSVAVLHRHEEAWMAQVFGRKLWVIGPPGYEELPADAYTRPCDEYRQQRHIRHGGEEAVRGQLQLRHCVLGPSDVMYLPDRWAHATCGLDAYNVAVGYIGAVDVLPPLHRAATVGDARAVLDLFDADATRTCAASSSCAQLAEPGRIGSVAVQELGVRAGESLLGGKGLFPLQWAAWNGHERLVALLSEKTEAVDRLDVEATTEALRWAAARGHAGVVRWLTQHGAQVSTLGAPGAKPIHWAAAAGHARTVAALLAGRADPNSGDEHGAGPTHWLAGGGNPRVLHRLLLARADPMGADAEGLTPAHAAAQFGHVELLQMLAAHRADLQAAAAETAQHVLPIHLAVHAGHHDVVELFARLVEAGLPGRI